jgi:hypothetical protein
MVGGSITLQSGQTTLIPKLHGEADYGAALLLEDGGDRGGIHATGHCDGDEAWLDCGADGKAGLELC